MDSKTSLSAHLNIVAKILNSSRNILSGIQKETNYNDEPKTYTYTTTYKTDHLDHENVAGGTSFSKDLALMRALGETIERYCISKPRNKKIALIGTQDQSSELIDLAQFTDFPINYSKRTTFKCVNGFSLNENKAVLIPAQLVYLSYPTSNEPVIRFGTSTGAAAGKDIKSALYTGICEVIERDAFTISYMNKLESPEIDLKALKDKSINRILEIFNRYNLEVKVLDITTDIPVPVFVALVLDRTGKGPAVSVGLKAGFETKHTIIGAIEEALMSRGWIRDRFIYGQVKHKNTKQVSSIEDRINFWLPANSIKYLEFWLNNKKKEIKINLGYSNSESLNRILEIFKKLNIKIYYADVTEATIRKSGFFVVKVIIPSLVPLHLDEKHKSLGNLRLFSVPIKIGSTKKDKPENILNNIPHPFL